MEEEKLKFCGKCKHFKYNPDGKGVIYRCEIFNTIGNNMNPTNCNKFKEGA